MYYRGSAAAVVVYDITSEVGTVGAVGTLGIRER